MEYVRKCMYIKNFVNILLFILYNIYCIVVLCYFFNSIFEIFTQPLGNKHMIITIYNILCKFCMSILGLAILPFNAGRSTYLSVMGYYILKYLCYIGLCLDIYSTFLH